MDQIKQHTEGHTKNTSYRSLWLLKRLFTLPHSPHISIFKDITFYMCMFHFFMHWSKNPHDPIVHVFINMSVLMIVLTTPSLFYIPGNLGKIFKYICVSGTILFYILGNYWLVLQYYEYNKPGYLNFRNIPYSVSTSIYPNLLTCTIVHAKQFRRKIGLSPMLFVLILTIFFTFDKDVNGNNTLLFTEYWLYSFMSYGRLY